ncbi:Tyrosine recombinase XerC [Hydrogenophaga sp. T4]|nr:Tyrosine recombinase XerC [Hydrogenophaga sp. T4]MDZ4290374.1 tyrosine-type recombinase/integrase [Hydrogenophaga sp.]
MTTANPTFGAIVYSFFLDYLPQQKGLRPSSIRSYRDTMRLFLLFAATQARRGVSELRFDDVGFERVLAFLRDLEQTRHNAVATRNQRLAGLHTFYEYVGRRAPELLHMCAQVAAIPMKRCPRPQTRFMEREEVQTLFARLPEHGRLVGRDRTLLLFLYNTGARVSEVAGLRIEQLTLTTPAHVRLLGKGGKWRSCPLWDQTVQALQAMLTERGATPEDCVFTAMTGEPMTRFGIYKRVRRLVADADTRESPGTSKRRISPHVFRHTTAVHLLEAGVEVNVIRGWLGHVSLETTNRYAEITARMKQEALKLCEPPGPAGKPRKPAWHDDAQLLNWLASL